MTDDPAWSARLKLLENQRLEGIESYNAWLASDDPRAVERRAAQDKALTDRAEKIAEALLESFGIAPCGTYLEEWTLEPASLMDLAEVIKPFLKP